MTIRSEIDLRRKDSWRRLRWLALAAAGAALIGCASTETARKEPTLRQDFLEYRQQVVLAMGQVDASMRALDELVAQANADPHRAYAAFAKAVHRLEVDSIRVRERVEAMRARGAGYFENWEKYLSGSDNEEVRRRFTEHRAELKESFEAARQASQQVRGTFRPFLTDLQKLRAVLEAQPDLVHIAAQNSLILAAKDKGREVQQGLDRILAEMNRMTALVRPASGPVKD